MSKFEFKISRFDGGLNTKVVPSLGAPDQSPSLQNVVFDDFGAVATRNGYTKFTSAAIQASAPIDGLFSYVKNDGTSYLVAAHNGTIWRASGNTFVTIGSAQNTFTTGKHMAFMTYQNTLWLSNGYDTPRKWDGTYFTKWGISAPSAATVATNSAGTLTGAYKYVILGVASSLAQGDYGSATTEVTLTAERAYLTEIPVFPVSAGVDTKLICRNTAAASGVYLVVTSIANATTVYADNNSDSTLLTFAPTDNGVPLKFTVMCEHLEYIFGASSTSTTPSCLYYSNINEPETFSAAYDFMKIGDGDGFKITGIIEFAGSLLVTKSDDNGGGSVYLIFTPDADSNNWTVSRLDTAYGNEARKTLVRFANFVMYLNRNGVFDLSEHSVGSIQSDSISYNIESEILLIAKSYMDNACAITFKNKVWLSVPYGTSQATNNKIFQYDFVKGRNLKAREAGSWSRFTNMNIDNMVIHAGNLYGGDSTANNGLVYQLDTGTNDNGAAIDSFYTTMAIRGLPQHEGYAKLWRHCYILVESSGAWNMELTYSNDFLVETGTTAQVYLGSNAAIWGTMLFGSSKWGTGNLRETITVDFLNSVSKSIQLKFRTNTINQYFKVHDVKLEYTLLGRR